jgi:hypothetical protein
VSARYRRDWSACADKLREGVRTVLRNVRRLLVVLAGMCGLLAVSGSAAEAMITWNHSEPVRSR